MKTVTSLAPTALASLVGSTTAGPDVQVPGPSGLKKQTARKVVTPKLKRTQPTKTPQPATTPPPPTPPPTTPPHPDVDRVLMPPPPPPQQQQQRLGTLQGRSGRRQGRHSEFNSRPTTTGGVENADVPLTKSTFF